MTSAEAARAYLPRGFQPIPIPHGAKKPNVKNWPKFRIESSEVDASFPTGCGIGLLLGENGGGLVDVDLDSAEAVRIGSMLLPATGWIHGRPTKPNSHHWYATNPSPKTKAFKDPVDGASLIELRSTGGQTNIPPTIHPSGEQLAWTSYTAPSPAVSVELERACARVAVAALLAKYWPSQGGRHDAALALAGSLLGAGVDRSDAELLVRATATAAGDDDIADRVRCVADTQSKIASGEPVLGFTRLTEIFGEKTAMAVPKWLGIRMTASGASGSKPSTRPKADAVLGLTKNMELFHDSSKQAYASFLRDGHRETVRIPSTMLSDLLRYESYQAFSATPSSHVLDECTDLLKAKALYDGTTAEVYYRIAQVDDTIYLDLGDDDRNIVEIDMSGWRLTPDCPLRFERPSTMRGLPLPVSGGSIDQLRPFINVADETAWRLLLIGLIGAFRPSGPYAILSIQGPYGSAKSTAAEVVRSLVDPAAPPLRSAPGSEDDLMIAASRSHLLVFDNLSAIPVWLSDALCRIATGGGFGKRQLYSDVEEIILDVERPTIITSIEEVITRGDLLDRSLIIELQTISPSARRPLKRVRADFELARPAILGCLLDAVAMALRVEPTVAIAELPRLADAARWSSAAAPALGLTQLTVLDALSSSRRSSHGVALGSWLASRAVLDLLQRQDKWIGTPTELLEKLTVIGDLNLVTSRRWPTTPSALTNKLKNLSPDFEALGVDIEFSRTGTARHVELRRNAQHVVMSVTDVIDDKASDGNDGNDTLGLEEVW
ncbi:MAG: hypothetical protein JWM90_34 [Thermoleophilia bacterium]|nr:hypothetical protein [Thermoleophilia bacterium]